MLVSVSEAARLKGVTKQTISEKLARLGIATAKRGREKVFSLAEYDAAANETTDPARIVAQETTKAARGDEAPPGGSAERDPGYTAQLARKAGFEADLKEMELQKLRGELRPIEEVTEVMTRCAEAIVRDIDQLPSFAEDLAGAIARGGVDALRGELKKRARQIRDTLARTMTLLAAEVDEPDEAPAA